MLGPLFEAGWTLDDIRKMTQDELIAVSTIMKRYSLVTSDIDESNAGEIVKSRPEMVEYVNRVIEEKRKLTRS